MNGPANDDSAPDFSDSDQQWFAALTGETPASDASTSAAREGVALRTALELHRQEIVADPALEALMTPEAGQQQLAQLQQLIAQEDLLDQPPRPAPPTVVAFPWWRRPRPLLALAASVLVAVGVVSHLANGPDYPPPSQTAGADGYQETHSPHPREAAERLAQQLRQAGLKAGLYQSGKTYVVDVTLLASEVPDAAPAFEALGLAPAPGFNRVSISLP